MIGDNLNFNTGSMAYQPTKSFGAGGSTSLGGGGWEAYLKPKSYEGIGQGEDYSFGQGKASYTAMNYQPTQSDVLGGSGSGTTSSIANGGQQSLGQRWDNMSTADKSGVAVAGVGLLASLLGGNKQEQQVRAPQVEAFRPHVGQLDMKQYSSRINAGGTGFSAPALSRVI